MDWIYTRSLVPVKSHLPNGPLKSHTWCRQSQVKQVRKQDAPTVKTRDASQLLCSTITCVMAWGSLVRVLSSSAQNLRKASKRHVSERKIYANRWVNESAIGTHVHKRPKIRCFLVGSESWKRRRFWFSVNSVSFVSLINLKGISYVNSIICPMQFAPFRTK